MVAIRCFHMIAAVAGFLSTRQESLGRMTTFEREVGAIFKMAANANERLRILQLQTGIMLVLTAIQRRKKREEQIVGRNHFNFLQIPPVTSSDIFKFFLRISCTHIKLFAYLRPAVNLNILVFITFAVLIVKSVILLHFFHEEDNIHFSTGRHFEECVNNY